MSKEYIDFNEKLPEINEQIKIIYPPEQLQKETIVIYDITTEWIDGCMWKSVNN